MREDGTLAFEAPSAEVAADVLPPSPPSPWPWRSDRAGPGWAPGKPPYPCGSCRGRGVVVWRRCPASMSAGMPEAPAALHFFSAARAGNLPARGGAGEQTARGSALLSLVSVEFERICAERRALGK